MIPTVLPLVCISEGPPDTQSPGALEAPSPAPKPQTRIKQGHACHQMTHCGPAWP